MNDRSAPTSPVFRSITPIFYVEEIEPALPFWVDRLGFERTVSVPDGDRLGFVILKRGDLEVMYQTVHSVQEDLPQIGSLPMGGTLLFIVVEEFDAIAAALEGADVMVPKRTTFYGATEIVVREPCGNVLTFAEMSGQS